MEMRAINITKVSSGQSWRVKFLSAFLVSAAVFYTMSFAEAAAQDSGATIGFTGTAKDCLIKDGAARDVCVSMIHSVRAAMKDGQSYGDFRACSPNRIDDMRDTHAVIEWIRQHPDRQDLDVNAVAREALSDLYPCS
jgi:hypothetical protein